MAHGSPGPLFGHAVAGKEEGSEGAGGNAGPVPRRPGQSRCRWADYGVVRTGDLGISAGGVQNTRSVARHHVRKRRVDSAYAAAAARGSAVPENAERIAAQA